MNRHAGFVQIYEFKSVSKADALKFGAHPDQATRTAAIEFPLGSRPRQHTQVVEARRRYQTGGAVPSWPIEDALLTLRIIEALFESARGGQWQLHSSQGAVSLTAVKCLVPDFGMLLIRYRIGSGRIAACMASPPGSPPRTRRASGRARNPSRGRQWNLEYIP